MVRLDWRCSQTILIDRKDESTSYEPVIRATKQLQTGTGLNKLRVVWSSPAVGLASTYFVVRDSSTAARARHNIFNHGPKKVASYLLELQFRACCCRYRLWIHCDTYVVMNCHEYWTAVWPEFSQLIATASLQRSKGTRNPESNSSTLPKAISPNVAMGQH